MNSTNGENVAKWKKLMIPDQTGETQPTFYYYKRSPYLVCKILIVIQVVMDDVPLGLFEL